VILLRCERCKNAGIFEKQILIKIVCRCWGFKNRVPEDGFGRFLGVANGIQIRKPVPKRRLRQSISLLGMEDGGWMDGWMGGGWMDGGLQNTKALEIMLKLELHRV